MTESELHIFGGSKCIKTLDMSAPLTVFIGVILGQVPQSESHISGIAIRFCHIVKLLDNGTSHQRIFNTEVVLPTAAEEHDITSFLTKTMRQRSEISERAHHRKISVGRAKYAYRTVSGAIGQPNASHIVT